MMSLPYLEMVVDIPRDRWSYLIGGRRLEHASWVRLVIQGRHVQIEVTHRPWVEKEQRPSKRKQTDSIPVTEETAQQWLAAAFGPEHTPTRRVIAQALPWTLAKEQQRWDRLSERISG